MNNLVKKSKKQMNSYLISFTKYWLTDASFLTQFFILVFSVFVLPILIEYGHNGSVFISSSFLFLFFTGIWSTRKPAIITLITVLFFVQLALRLIRFSNFEFEFYLIERLVGLLNMLAFILVNLRQLFRDEEVGFYRVIGAVNVYLLVAILGAFLYEVIYITTGTGIGGEVVLKGLDKDFSTYIYFSMVSMTTVGFGELYPIHIMSKMLSVFLSMIGILYPTVIIAKLVSGSNLLKNR